MGFAEEALDWVQVGWGTHERPLPRMLSPTHGSRNQIFVPMHAMDLVMDSYVPHTPIKGMCIPHGEADTITEALTVYDDDSSDDSSDYSSGDDCDESRMTREMEEKKRSVVYRPSVYYVYQCAAIAVESLCEMRQNKYVPQSKYHVLTPGDDGLKGEDRVGVLLMFEDNPVRTIQGDTDDKKPWSYW
jgi:homospermidine synthase